MRVWAFDPGKKVGLVSWWRLPTDVPRWVFAQGSSIEMVHATERGLESTIGKKIIVAERYTFTSSKHTRQYDALEMIGALRYLAWKYGATFELQSRADKARVPDETLKALNLYVADREHLNDATRHMLIAIARHRLDEGIMRQLASTI